MCLSYLHTEIIHWFKQERVKNDRITLFFQIVNQDAEILRQILDQTRYAPSSSGMSRTNSHPPSRTSRQLMPLRALTEQLKRTSTVSPSQNSNEEAERAAKVLDKLQTLNMKIDSNLQLLEQFIAFLRTSEQVRAPDSVKCFSLL